MSRVFFISLSDVSYASAGAPRPVQAVPATSCRSDRPIRALTINSVCPYAFDVSRHQPAAMVFMYDVFLKTKCLCKRLYNGSNESGDEQLANQSSVYTKLVAGDFNIGNRGR